MGNANVPKGVDKERDDAVAELVEAASTLRMLQAQKTKDDAWLTQVLKQSDVAVEYDRKLTLKILSLHEDGARSTKILELIEECKQILTTEQAQIENLLAEREQARLSGVVDTMAPGLLALVADYKTKAGQYAVAGLRLELLAARLSDLPVATAKWEKMAEGALASVRNIKDGDKRGEARAAWFAVRDTVEAQSQVLFNARKDERAKTLAAFTAHVAGAETLLQTPLWTVAAKAELNDAVCEFERRLSPRWQITEEQLVFFYKLLVKADPIDVLVAHGAPAFNQYQMPRLFHTSYTAGHTGRVRLYLTDLVVPAAEAAGFDITCGPVISFVQVVAVAWCSAVEGADTGGSPSRVANSTRGEVPSRPTVLDIEAEPKAGDVSLVESMASVQRLLDRELEPRKRFLLLANLKRMQQDLEAAKHK